MKNTDLVGQDLLNCLAELDDMLWSLHLRLAQSGVARTHGLREWKGEQCGYFVKSLALFLQKDYNDIKELVQKTESLFSAVEE